ncbi:MAG: hypothetical protein ABIH83_05035 [Candidatus Micrarchaeota archaeon]
MSEAWIGARSLIDDNINIPEERMVLDKEKEEGAICCYFRFLQKSRMMMQSI